MIIKSGGIKEMRESNLGEYLEQAYTYRKASKQRERLYISGTVHCPLKNVLDAHFSGEEVHSLVKHFYVEQGNFFEQQIVSGWFKNILVWNDYHLPDIEEQDSNILDIGGKIDAITFSDEILQVVEIKNVGTLPKGKPKYYHLQQAVFYSAVTRLPYSLFYVSRNVADWAGEFSKVQFSYPYSQQEAEFIMTQTHYAHSCSKAGVLPVKPDYIKAKYICTDSYCRNVNVCWGGEEYIGDDLENITPAQHEEFMFNAKEFAKYYTSEERSKHRRNGIINHWVSNGNKIAKSLLKYNWDEITQL